MSNPLGITGQKRSRMLSELLRVELLADDGRKLRAVVTALVNAAIEREAWAQALLWDRAEGKVPQPVGGSEELGPQKLQIEWKFSQSNELAPAPGGAPAVEHQRFPALPGKQDDQVIDLPAVSVDAPVCD